MNMHNIVFEHMKTAKETAEKSFHPTHKVGAVLCGHDNFDQPYKIAHSNYWPETLEKHIGRNQKLGKASTTVHAEVAVILKSPSTEGAELYVTELPCPNCAKVIAEARIKTVYVDAQTHSTPLGKKLKSYFDEISHPILQSAGVKTFEINTQSETIHEITNTQDNILRPIEHPVIHIPLEYEQINADHFKALTDEQKITLKNPFAACYAKTELGQYTFLCAQSHRSLGLTKEQAETIKTSQKKYSPVIHPINRLLLTCARYGLKIDENYLYSSQTPTSREFVNLIGADITTLTIGNANNFYDESDIKALKQLTDKNLIRLSVI